MKILLSLALAALSFNFGATATPTDVASRTDRPTSLLREAIPAGATVYGRDAISIDDRDGGPFSEIGKRAVTDCDHGLSALCGLYLAKPSTPDCDAAAGAYDDNAWYCGYTSRFSGHCIAKFSCRNFNNVCWAGWFLKNSFLQISCQSSQCGTRYFDDFENCSTTYDYCANCHNTG